MSQLKKECICSKCGITIKAGSLVSWVESTCQHKDSAGFRRSEKKLWLPAHKTQAACDIAKLVGPENEIIKLTDLIERAKNDEKKLIRQIEKFANEPDYLESAKEDHRMQVLKIARLSRLLQGI